MEIERSHNMAMENAMVTTEIVSPFLAHWMRVQIYVASAIFPNEQFSPAIKQKNIERFRNQRAAVAGRNTIGSQLDSNERLK